MSVTKLSSQLFDTKGKPLSLKIDKEGMVHSSVEILSDDIPVALGLRFIREINNHPLARFAYLAFGNPRGRWEPTTIRTILEYADKRNLQVRAWENNESAIQLIVVQETDTSEDSGYELYKSIHGQFESLGVAHFTEWLAYGVEINPKSTVRDKAASNGAILIIDLDESIVVFD